MNLKSSCYPLDLLIANIALAGIDGALASIAFSQVLSCFSSSFLCLPLYQSKGDARVELCSLSYVSAHQDLSAKSTIWMDTTESAPSDGWILQLGIKVTSSTLYPQSLLLVIGGFAGLMHVVLSSWVGVPPAFPSILLFAVFLLLLSFWVDLCHQANEEDDDEEENSSQQPLLESSKNKPGSTNTDSFWRCCSFRGIQVGSHQKFVITVVVLIFFLMLSFAVVIWIGAGKNPIDSSVVARVYVDLFATAILILGGALGCYGLILFLKLRKVRSETASSETRKVAGLAVVSVVCFMSSAAVALLTDIPLLYRWSMKNINEVKTLVLLVFYYFIGSSVPSAFVLWVMRELPTPVTNTRAPSRAVAFISYGIEETPNPRHWVAATTSKNQVSKASPI
ncbi:hypothetical protein SADUNF_Sadunf05G0149000 [Salix dunnii]|uniref:THH1/TOM1/TOM3 domain-containing protein n=1 Tax=Salix dunnii TaxID=1413687 RepID=A0A835K494_9ROSI|nr:hypothetical protein SADUNF_Sadunf05G0149000 [Salix dunnii]